MGVWPTEALAARREGAATMVCTVTVQGTLRGCKITSESPQDAGFGAATLALAAQFLMKPATVDGRPAESEVTIPIAFRFPRQNDSPWPQGGETSPQERIYLNVAWVGAPSVTDVSAAYPAKAREQNVGGIATLTCRVGPDGGLVSCKGLREEPKGLGFEKAARALTSKFRGPTVDADGKRIGSYRTSITFAFAPRSLAGSVAVGRPKWTALPTAEDFIAVFPDKARVAGVYKARVVLGCTVNAKGGADGCSVVSEDPAGLDLGAAALALAPHFGLNLWTDEGLPIVGGPVRIPIRFDLTPAAEDHAPTR